MTGSPRILIVGGAGQVGRELQRSFASFGDIVAVDRESLDIAIPEEIRALIPSCSAAGDSERRSVYGRGSSGI